MRVGKFDQAHMGIAETPISITGAQMTVHWIRGGFQANFEDVLGLVNEVTQGGYIETKDWGRFMYQRHAVFIGGICVYTQPRSANMPAILVDCPGQGCELLGLEKLQRLFESASTLSRIDIAFDGAPFTPLEASMWVEEGNIRGRVKVIEFTKGLRGGRGDLLRIGSRSSEQMVRIYDRRGHTRVELELKGAMARAFKPAFLAGGDELVRASVGALREYVDFVDASRTKNISRAPLLEAWAKFTKGLERVKLQAAGSVTDSLERVANWLEHQVSAMLWTYHRAGRSVGDLLQKGRSRLRERHTNLLRIAEKEAAFTV